MFDGESKGQQDNAMLCLKASALYRVSYCPPLDPDIEKYGNQSRSFTDQAVELENRKSANNAKYPGEVGQGEPYERSLGLPWIFCHLLCMIKKESSVDSSSALQKLRETELRPSSFLHKLSLEITSVHIIETAKDLERNRNNNHEQSGLPLLIERLHLLSNQFSYDSNKRVQLICFGSVITSCATNPPSLNIFVHTDSSVQSLNQSFERLTEIANELLKLVGGNLMKTYGSKPKNTINIVNIEGSVTKITLFSDQRCLRRTAYIVAAVTLNKWTIPVLRVILRWGKNCRLTDGSHDSLLTEEELTIIFYHVVTNRSKYGNPVTDECLSRANLLIMQNHFQMCNLFQCTHLMQSDSLDVDKTCSAFRATIDSLDSAYTGDIGNKEEETGCGHTLLKFFRYVGISRGSNLKEIKDPRQTKDGHCLLNLKDEQFVQIGEQMMEAYHSLANCSSIDDFLSSNSLEDRRFRMVLPNEVTSLFRYVEKYWEKTLKSDTGTGVVFIRTKKFRGFDPLGHVIEAWGSATAIKRLRAKVQGIIGSTSCFTEGKIARDRWSISGAYRTIFEGISGPKANLKIFEYDGRCQHWHNERQKQVPLVTYYHYSDDYNLTQMASYFEEQGDFIRKNYQPDIHGKIRVTISFGNVYTTGFKWGMITADALGKMLGKWPRSKKSAHVERDIRSPADYRQKGLSLRANEVVSDYSNKVHGKFESLYQRPTGNNIITCRPSFPNSPSTNNYGRFDSNSASLDSMPGAADTIDCGISIKPIPPSACHDSNQRLAESSLQSSECHRSGATGHSVNSSVNDSSVDRLTNCPTQRICSKRGVQVGCNEVSGPRGPHNPAKTEHLRSTSFPGPIPRKDSAFIPMNDLDLDRFNDFLKQHDFVETEHVSEYRVTADLDVSYGDITLDDDFELTSFRLQDIKWYVVNVVRGRMGERHRYNQAKDIRIQMRSRPLITAEQLAERDGCQELLDNARGLLHKNSAGEVDGIALCNYWDKIKYMRYKCRTSYQFRGKTRRMDSEDSFLNRFTLKLNRGKEYRIPKEDGIFSQITDQTELMLESDCPNLDNKEECDEFMREIYEFSKDFARSVVD